MRWFLIIALSTSAWAQTAPFAPPEDISFRRANIISEGTRMSAEVFAPKASADKKLPTILMAHGWGGTAALLRPDAIAFARAGYLAVTFRSAEVFAPKASADKKLPTILMAHGWGGTAALLRPDAIAFARAGYLAVTFDYRGWGDSDSRVILTAPEPREHPNGRFTAEVQEVREVVDPMDEVTD